MPKHTCALCGLNGFSTYTEYETHRTEVHGMKTLIRAENISGRTREQIARDAEATWLKPYLIETDAPEDKPAIVSNNDEHLPACYCQAVCFQKKLDALIASQESSLESLTNGGHNANTI